MRFSAFFILMLNSVFALGQSLHCAEYAAAKIIPLDSFPVEPQSVSLVPDLSYDLISDGTAIRLLSNDLPDSLSICFRKISEVVRTPIFYRDVAKYDAGSYSRESRSQTTDPPKETAIFSFGSLNTYGAITRGVSFGNRQNVFVNSSLNLQMDGSLTDDLKVSAVITDQNVPYQPEGNTQQIRDFDNVFIKLYNDSFSLTAGDIVLQNTDKDQYFLQYYKNVQGLQLHKEWEVGGWKNRSQISASLSKGQFISAVVEPIEGVQGPYKLRGANGERFIIVLANSERVFLDGKLLNRGFDQDYVIDYNLSEITFSNTTVVTQFSRIRVDYEYANQYYSRSNIAAHQRFEKDNVQLYLNYYQEKDNPGSALGFDLSDKDLNNLRASGDALNGTAIISGIDSVGFFESAILYAKIDTVNADGAAEVIYQYSTDPNAASFQLSFSLVESGSYELISTTSNGRIYEWVGAGNGSYEPVQLIPTPNQKRMIVLGTKVKISSFEQVSQETAFSRQDQNLYSRIEDDDNQGLAWKGSLSSVGRNFEQLPAYKMEADVSFEYNHENFRFIDRFRPPDYDWTWNYDVFSDTVQSRRDMILNTRLSFRENQQNGAAYSFSWRNRDGVIDGNQQSLELNKTIGGLQIDSRNSLLQNMTNTLDASWIRSAQKIQFNDWPIRPGYEFSIDHNVVKAPMTDSVISTQMNFTQHNLFAESGDSSKMTYRFDLIDREDFLPVLGDLSSYTKAREYRLSFSANQMSNQRISGQLNYRSIRQPAGEESVDRNVIGKISWAGRFAKDHIVNNLSFTTASVRELRREFIFISVPNGEGTHTWRDENEDGIQDINEFYESINEDEKNFIKIFTPTDEYVEAFQTAYIHSLEIRAPRSWKNRNGVLPQLSKLSFMSNLRSQYKTTSSKLLDRLEPFQSSLANEDLVSVRSLMRTTLFYNRNAPGVGLDLTRTSQGSKSLLSTGFQIKEIEEWLGSYRFAIGSVITIRGNAATKETNYSSDFLESRNFSIDQKSGSMELVLQPTRSFRLISSYARRNKSVSETELTDEGALINELKVESTWTKAGKGNLNAAFSWIDIDYTGETNTFLSYELLEALQPGSNQRWNVNWQQALGRGLQLTLQYFGRKSPSQAAVHTGTVQVTAFF